MAARSLKRRAAYTVIIIYTRTYMCIKYIYIYIIAAIGRILCTDERSPAHGLLKYSFSSVAPSLQKSVQWLYVVIIIIKCFQVYEYILCVYVHTHRDAVAKERLRVLVT